MKPLLVTFDVEELDWGRATVAAEEATGRSAEGIGRILPVLEKSAVRATFFCTALFARSRPGEVRAIRDRGHEVASHGWKHGDRYEELSPGRATGLLRDSRRLLEDVTGRAVIGLRTPRLSACSAEVLSSAGFAYDASPQPSWVKMGFRGLRMSRQPWREAGILRVPLSVVPLVRIPVSWYVFRVSGAGATGVLARMAGVGAPFIHLYFHPWEAADLDANLARHPLGWRTGPLWLDRLGVLLSRLARDFAPHTVAEFEAEWRGPSAAGPMPGSR